MLKVAAEFFFKSTTFFFSIGLVGSFIWLCAICAAVAWAYRRYEPLTPTESRLAILVPKIWVIVSFLACFKPQGFGGHIVILGFWAYLAYAIVLFFSQQRIRFLVFFSALLVLSLMSAIGLFAIAMTGEL